jgi:hypothetical protein
MIGWLIVFALLVVFDGMLFLGACKINEREDSRAH